MTAYTFKVNRADTAEQFFVRLCEIDPTATMKIELPRFLVTIQTSAEMSKLVMIAMRDVDDGIVAKTIAVKDVVVEQKDRGWAGNLPKPSNDKWWLKSM